MAPPHVRGVCRVPFEALEQAHVGRPHGGIQGHLAPPSETYKEALHRGQGCHFGDLERCEWKNFLKLSLTTLEESILSYAYRKNTPAIRV